MFYRSLSRPGPTGEPLPAATEGVDDTEVAYDRDESYVKATEGGEAYGTSGCSSCNTCSIVMPFGGGVVGGAVE